jgi:thiol:disulfide interchange protein DsbD
MIEQYLTSGSILMIPVAYFSGLLVSLTPCVYPLIPVTISFIGGQKTSSRWRAFFISVVYVLGISVTYSVLGVIASLTGKIFGIFSRSPIVFVLVGVLFIFLGLNMSEIIYIPFLEFNFFTPKDKPKNLFSVFLVGTMSGLVVGACTSPVLGAILSFIAMKQNLVLGIFSMISFAFGMGTILIIVGTFSNIIILKSGKWMVWIKKVLGIILILMGIYFIYDAIQMII